MSKFVVAFAPMKKTKSTKRSSAAKPSGVPRTVEEYLARVPEPARTTLDKLRAAIKSAMPAGMTEVINYRIPAFRGRRVLVWYAAFSDHVSFFPTGAVVEAFQDDLKDFNTSKGTVQFPLGKPIPVALIKKMVKKRIEISEPKRPRITTKWPL